jgi:hypothetical protein
LKKSTLAVSGGLIVAAIVVAAWLLRRETPAPPVSSARQAAAASTPAFERPVASAPAVRYPIEPLDAQAAGEPHDIESALTDVFGRKSVLALFQLDGFASRFVATVDNLGRERAPTRLWPLNPAPGQFTVDKRGDVTVLSADNGLRYTPYVLLAESADVRQLVTLYVRLYPQLQQAYEELGYPGRYFNDRLVEVIDQLLATPDVASLLEVRLPPVDASVQLRRPWLLYEFADPALQSLTAGQKLLLRMGPVNQRRMKAKLVELRRLLTARPPGR